MTASLSVVIPAHNEANVLGRTLDTLLAGAEPGEMEIVVACNGCTDRTVEIARSYAPAVTTLVVRERSKAAALNAGDAAATVLPRVFLDADIEVDVATLRGVRDALTPPGGALAAAPHLRVDTAASSWPVRAYYDVWLRLPYAAAGLLGTGFYALSAHGRGRFERFPDLVADDLFVQRLFGPAERAVTPGEFRVRPPRDLGSLMRSKTRVYAGNLQYAAAARAGEVPTAVATGARDAGTGGTGAALTLLAREPRWWPRLILYAGIVVTTKGRAEIRVRRGRTTRWDQDESGRSA